jgi:hypothetical protein
MIRSNTSQMPTSLRPSHAVNEAAEVWQTSAAEDSGFEL